MFVVAASFLMYISLALYQAFWGPYVAAGQFPGFEFTFVGGKGMLVVAGRWMENSGASGSPARTATGRHFH